MKIGIAKDAKKGRLEVGEHTFEFPVTDAGDKLMLPNSTAVGFYKDDMLFLDIEAVTEYLGINKSEELSLEPTCISEC